MQANQTPTLVPLAFAAGGAFNTIPEASQIGTNPGGASLVDGFPPLTRTPIAAGGIPPSGLDMNGVLNLITQSTRWAHGGGRYAFNSAFAADTNVGGYPAGAMLMSADGFGTWLSLVDNNSDNPDTGPGTKWAPSQAYGFSAISGLTNVNVTLTPAQAMKSRIVLTGALTGNVQIILPTWTREWTVVNNTTGAFTITAKTASGTGVAIPAGAARVVCDGTNVTQPAESIASATLASHALTAGQIGAIGSQGNLPINTSAKVNGVNAANLLFNGSGEFGNAGWLAANFASTSGGFGEGTIFLNGAAITSGASLYDQANNFACGSGVALTLSAEVSAGGLTAGFAAVGADFLDGSLNIIGGILSPNIGPGAPRQFVSVSGTTPASTAFVRIYKMCGGNPRSSSFGVSFRRIKVEQGTSPSIYSQEASIAAVGSGMPVVGSARNVAMGVATASATATLTADEIIVCSALGGVAYKLANFNKTVNLATTGAGGMDTGSAPTSGFVAIYAIYNPTTQTTALLARNAATLQPTVYGGSNMPSGYTASALVSVWPTNGSGQFVAGYQRGSRFYYQSSPTSLTNGAATGPTAVSVSSQVPANALDFTIAVLGVTITTNSSGACSVQSFVEAASGIARQQTGFLGTFGSASGSVSFAGPSAMMPNINQQYYYASTVTTGSSPQVTHAIPDYRIASAGE
ncbi:hypothetical protein [Burkholderia cepacia]|uniref:hypothetical protein n=1 Tax=Burkholderia cepacia TaxID=292 RepID=UPI001F2D18CE|nr:hypothetical protein [Burkholderia cepacia]MCE4125363.1 hypothetical protein [Burkholderia cepacia]